MIVFSVIAYIGIAAWYLLGNDKSQRISSVVATCLSSFFAFWFWGENDIAMIIYVVMGLICVFFHWISIDVKNANLQAKSKNKTVAAVLALFLGGFGIHRFYLRKSTSGLLYILFSWSIIPGIIGIIEAIRFFSMKQDKFDALFNRTVSAIPAENMFNKSQQAELPHEECAHTYAEDKEYVYETKVNERDGDKLNYRNIRVCGYKAEAVGAIDDFSIVINANGNTYTFKAKNGDICSYRSSSMRGTKHYEVV